MKMARKYDWAPNKRARAFVVSSRPVGNFCSRARTHCRMGRCWVVRESVPPGLLPGSWICKSDSWSSLYKGPGWVAKILQTSKRARWCCLWGLGNTVLLETLPGGLQDATKLIPEQTDQHHLSKTSCFCSLAILPHPHGQTEYNKMYKMKMALI